MSDSLPTPLFDWHLKNGAKMVDFAAHKLPLSYAGGGLLAEHLHTRRAASLFDVSHMGQILVTGDTAALSSVMPADVAAILPGKSKYTMLTLDNGGILDDCIIGKEDDKGYFLVLNASRKTADLQHLRARLSAKTEFAILDDRALIAVQGPAAAGVVGDLFPAALSLFFMESAWLEWDRVLCRVARCGYTGEDGFEISAPSEAATDLAQRLSASGVVKPAGLSARDSLRLEAGLCLYGNDINEQTSPIEAGLLWTIPKHRRESADYTGATIINRQIADKSMARKLVAILPQGKVPVRAGAVLAAADSDSDSSSDASAAVEIGVVTSGVFSPTLSTPIAMGYVKPEWATAGAKILATVRGKQIPCVVIKPPFVAHNYHHSKEKKQ